MFLFIPPFFNYCTEVREEDDGLISKYIHGHHSLRLSDFRFLKSQSKPLQLALKPFSLSTKAQCLIFSTAFELEPQIITSLRSSLPLPVLPIGPAIPYSTIQEATHKDASQGEEVDYLTFLNSQPQSSVLYVSLGSYLSVSGSQMDEIAFGLQASNVKFLWAVRDEASRLREIISGGSGQGMVVTWCEQLRVLCHPSVGGFLTHCGWNSMMEAAFAGVPVLTFPIIFDQVPDSRLAVDEWGVGIELRGCGGSGEVVGREKVSELVRRMMELEGDESRELRKKAARLSEACRSAVEEDGSSSTNLSYLIKLLSPAAKY